MVCFSNWENAVNEALGHIGQNKTTTKRCWDGKCVTKYQAYEIMFTWYLFMISNY